MKRAHLGDLDVARLGLGTMGMSFAYTGAGSDDAESMRTIHRAIDLGVNLIDTAEVYGPFINEGTRRPCSAGPTRCGSARDEVRDDVAHR
jgi:aryl-alcohol dehydrogenase-like predicted oxidoreductase